ncbi:hypothetical protein PQQ87_08690 [Paraburkholderia nemoris]|uniref:hypothetical protein n=1 Tax=Paraburkholderia nemoris TaxID=2793076 RepID=UPI0038BA8CCF
MSDTKNVRLGVCTVTYNGVDLGYTQGGVEVTVKTDTHQVNVDQFGKTPINEYIMGRSVEVKVPLAETTIDNLVQIMPGATMSTVGGTVAQGAITVGSDPVAGETVIVNGITFTWQTTPVDSTDVQIGSTAAACATNLANVLAASQDPALTVASYSANTSGVVTILYGPPSLYGSTGEPGTLGNSFTLSNGTSGAAVTVSGATLSGGTDPTQKSVSVSTGIGTDLLSLAKPLRLHPVDKADGDVSDDFVVPLAATSGALNFAYDLEKERIYDVTFTGYPNAATGQLFTIGE